ncbi:hypothetical protein [Fodinibius sp. AD559]|uniref:hypothetical protein n=1 Tax=Fodinibius sp. AD559 TaxID=3424179 RepID=UPI004046A70F
MNIVKTIKILAIALVITGFWQVDVKAQGQGGQGQPGQQFRLGERIIRVAEPGQLADTVNVWGDVGSPGRYLIPRKTTLPQLISYAFGPRTINDQQTQLDWSKMRIEINISEFNPETGQEVITNFEYRLNEPLPRGMRNFKLENNQVVSLQVKRRPSIIDYARVIGSIATTIGAAFIIVDRVR